MKRRIGRITLSMIMSALMVLTMPLTALAGEWDIAEGDIAVNRTSETEQNVSQGSRSENDTNPTITGTSTEHTVTIHAETGTTATVTLDSVDITSSSGNAPISTQGGGNVTIELDGDSKVQADNLHAGIEKNNDGDLTITDSSGSSEAAGSIEAKGGSHGAGIGGGFRRDGSDITINGNAQVTASGGTRGAGIGGGDNGNGSDITIGGHARVTASSGDEGAGIGGGFLGDGSNITINGNAKVTASGGSHAAGIGGGGNGNGSDITIQDNSSVISTSSTGGAGIGSGIFGTATNITIRDNANVHVASGFLTGPYGDFYGAGIGNGAAVVANGTEVVDDTNLTTGKITIYDPGTSIDEIKAYIEQAQSQSGGQQTPGGSSQQVPSGSGQQNPPSAPTSTNIVVDNTETAPPEVPSSHGGSSHSSDNNGGSVNTATPTNEHAIFITALNNQIEGYLKQLSEAIKSGNTEKANAMIKEGLKLNLGNYVGLNRRTITLLEEVSKAGIATTIDFTYKNIDYITLIPANAEIAPTSLLNKDGYCGALKLMKEYGRIEENYSPSDIG
ncbi:hypothetical protein D6853_01295 [Butyrivibrio sp. X503]|uniref:hypothetical protein n=1 Tax=Butyrivibrio sp. X503 TaxID=2364878 RepID=UPI000EAA69CD|nr:hypothetical protein [Butyrivibrio sp. X503]RKM58201.1 hypothetical protein D6853_01295 [Butyrivibrio sp. X503]